MRSSRAPQLVNGGFGPWGPLLGGLLLCVASCDDASSETEVPDLHAAAPDVAAADLGRDRDQGGPPDLRGGDTPDQGLMIDEGPADEGAPDQGPAPDGGSDAGPPDAGPLGEPLRIVRDPWGVPHVQAQSFRGAGYGYGWAQAEDQLVLLLTNMMTALGRRTEVEGEEMLEVDRSMRLLRLVADVERDWDAQPAEIKEYLEGFAQGVNAYMEAHPEEVPSWAEPIRPTWPVAFGRLFFLSPQLDRANSDRGGLGPGMVTLAFDGMNEFSTFGSNGWAIHPERISEGVGVFLGDPHMPWSGPWRMYEGHLSAPGIEAAGGGFVGLPLPIFARNRHVVWTFTWNLPDGGDVYRLTLDPDDPERYLFDGEPRAFERSEEVFRLPDGRELRETLRWSVHGPVPWWDEERGLAAAFALATFNRTGIGQQMLEMFQSSDLDEWIQAMSHLELGSFAVVAADSSGSGVFVWNGRVPRRAEGVDSRAPIDGSTSATLWDPEDVVPFTELPTVRDPAVGYVQNCNNAPWWTTGAPEDPQLEDQPQPGVYGGDVDTERAWRFRSLLNPPGQLSVEEARGIATEGDMIPAGPMLPLLREAWRIWGAERADAERLQPVFELLETWDGEPLADSAAPTVFMLWAYSMFETIFFPPEALLWTVEDDLDEERGQQMLDAMTHGLDQIEDLVHTWDVPWGFVHGLSHAGERYSVLTGQHPVVSMFNCNVDPFQDPELSCKIGSAYTNFTLLEEPLRSWTVTPLGNTEDPEKPYVNAQTELFARRELKPLPFTEEELAEHPLTETLLHLPPSPAEAR